VCTIFFCDLLCNLLLHSVAKALLDFVDSINTHIKLSGNVLCCKATETRFENLKAARLNLTSYDLKRATHVMRHPLALPQLGMLFDRGAWLQENVNIKI
jgi:hypothetical protein